MDGQATVRAIMRKMRRFNSVAFVQQMRAKWGRADASARFRRLLREKVRRGLGKGEGGLVWGGWGGWEMWLDRNGM